ncbi:MAG: ADOP family duplicated permease [Terracidiphilus sp.]
MFGLSQLFTRRRRYDDLSVSIDEHIAERADELVAEGRSRTEAEQTARREFGNVALIEQRGREAWQWPTAESVLADMRYALRQLIKSPGFTVTAVVTLALGIAVNATMFSMVSAFLLPHFPGRDPQSMVVVSSVNPDAQMQPDTNPVSAPNYFAWSKDTRVFSAMAAGDEYRSGSLTGQGQQPEAITYAAVSPNYFSVFGVSPALGRSFLAGEDQAGRDHMLILSHGLWERRFGSDPSVVGRVVRLNREDYVIAGVMPADFHLLAFTPQLWTPLTLTGADATADARKNRNLYLFARLAQGVTLQQARGQMTILAQQAQHDSPSIEGRWGASVRTLPDFLIYRFGIRTALAVIMTVVGFVLLIACANVAGLLLTRAVGRQKELAIRMSLGATRVRVVRQLVTEGVVIALLGGGVGLFLTYCGIRVVSAGLSFNDAIADVKISLDTNVLIFAAVVSLVSAILSSVAPALKASRTEINTDLKSEGRGASSGREHNRMRVVLVGGEIAVALFLLIGSCLLIRGVYLLDHQKLGFNHDHLLTAGLVLDQARYADASKQRQFVREIGEQLRQIPGVEAVATASDLPASGLSSVSFHIKGQPEARTNEQRTTADVVVTREYFEVVGVPLLRGRAFTEGDDAAAPRAILVNQEFVRKYFQDHDPIGKQIQLDTAGAPATWSEIVGVVSDVKSYSEDPHIEAEVYEAYLQRPVASFSVMLRSTAEPNSLTPALRRVVAQTDPELPLLRVMNMDQVIEFQKSGNPLFEKLLATFAILALMLSAIGIYGLIAYSVGQRTHEIGIRLALGAKASDISRMILREGLKVAGIGSAIGFVLALPLPKLFESLFQGILLGAPEVYPLVLVMMLIVAFCATFGPARRARQVDPMTALRNE